MGLDKKRPAWITTSIYTDYWLVWLYLLTFEISCATAARWRFLASVITLSLGMMLIEWRQVFKVHWPSLNSYYSSCHSYANALVTRSISLHDTLAYMQCKSSAWFQNRCALVVEFGILWRFPSAKFQSQISSYLTKKSWKLSLYFDEFFWKNPTSKNCHKIFGDFQLLWKAITRLHSIPKLPSW